MHAATPGALSLPLPLPLPSSLWWSMDVGCCSSSQVVRPPLQLDLLPWDPVVPPTLRIKRPTPEPPIQAQEEGQGKATTHTTTLSMSSFQGQGRDECEGEGEVDEDEGEVDEELEEQEQEGQSCTTTSSSRRRRRDGRGGGGGVGVGVPRKKLRLSKEQSVVLEQSFRGNTTLNPRQKQALAKQLGLLPRQVEVWFQNRRARTKLKQTEMDCEHLRRCCEMLTQQNARLRRELQELRALKLCSTGGRSVHAATASTSLRMCPSCERLAVAAAAAAASRPPQAMMVQQEAYALGAPAQEGAKST